jgi:hypothetical protein
MSVAPLNPLTYSGRKGRYAHFYSICEWFRFNIEAKQSRR